MKLSDWLSSGIALTALGISALTAYFSWRWRSAEMKRADLTAYFHRNSEMAKVRRPSGSTALVGYNLVLLNRGPAPATAVRFQVTNAQGTELSLVDLVDGELPLSRLEPNARYPLPWLLSTQERSRYFECTLTWEDGSGPRSLTLPLRRGETRQ